MTDRSKSSTAGRVAALFAPAARLQRLLDVEAALARAAARVGLVPARAALAIAEACRAELYDEGAIFAEGDAAGTPIPALVREIGARAGGEAEGFVHLGATSQDILDTAFVLQARDALSILEAALAAIAGRCAGLAQRHRHTRMPGRTLLQQAVPISFGLKAARWLSLLTRQRARLRADAAESLALQLGGAAGTLAALGAQGIEVTERLAEELALPAPALPWHAERDRPAALAASLGVLAGALGKIAADVVLLAQTEVAEATEGAAPGKGGSSAMPQKRNPKDAVAALASVRLAQGLVPVVLGAMIGEHERAAGAWQAELVALPTLFKHTAAALDGVYGALMGLTVDADRMSANLASGGGLLMAEALATALAARLGRNEARRLVAAACGRAGAAGGTLREAALADATIVDALGAAGIDEALDPARSLGSADIFIDRALAEHATEEQGP